MLIQRFQAMQISYELMILAAIGLYLLIRFGGAWALSKYTVHRGMFHSLPAAFIFAGVVFLLCGCSNLQLRYFKAGGVFLGVMSHLTLDEIYAIDWKRGRIKKSFGTALKLWGSNWWSNISTYGKLAIVVLMILGEPMVMERYGTLSPVVLKREDWAGKIAFQDTNTPASQQDRGPTADDPNESVSSGKDVTIYDTAQRIWQSLRE